MEYKSGIYKIINTKNNKIYIGSAVDLNKRWLNHLNELRKNKHHNIHLQRSFNKNGETCLSFIIIEKCDTNVLIDREQYYIDTLNPKYNICKVAGNCTGRVVSEETKKKISDKLMGIPLKEERKLNMRNRVWSEESKAKLSKSLKGKKHDWPKQVESVMLRCAKPVILFSDGNKLEEFPSIIACSKYLKVRAETIRKVLIGELELIKDKYKVIYK